jgi:nucleotide-binding universal stress UspA family protein
MKDKVKLLVGYDGSGNADAALDDLQQAGLPDNCEALLMSVAEVWLPPPSSHEILGMVKEETSAVEFTYEKQLRKLETARENVSRASERLMAKFPRWDISSETASGSPAWELLCTANQWKADLIVVGSHGRSALGRFVLGSVSQKVVTEAICSVRVARGRVEEPSPARIVLAIDGSAGAEAAVRAVGARNWPAGSEVCVVIVDDPIDPTLAGEFVPGLRKSVVDAEVAFREQITKMVYDVAAQLSSETLSATGLVKEGNPKKEIIKLAEEWGANCIFVGSTGFSNPLERFLIGSVASAITARAHCSVEVVREPKSGN